MAARPPVHRKAVVVAGAGARGAYEAGALAQALPILFPRGLDSTYLIGTSAGAINVALLAARIGAGVPAAVGELPQVWQQIHRANVFDIDSLDWLRRFGDAGSELTRITTSNIVGTLAGPAHLFAGLLPPPLARPLNTLIDVPGQLANGVVGAVTDVASIPVRGALAQASSLLDTAPLWATAARHIDFEALNRNVDEGRLAGVGIVATSCPMDASGGRSRVFLKTRDGVVPAGDGGSIDYVATDEITAQHVLASAAIPSAFPPIEVETPALVAGWYVDGGVRLNTPLEPAIKLGSRQILVVSSHAAKYPPAGPLPRRPPPTLLDSVAQSIHSVLADGLIEDLRNVDRVNAMVAAAAPSGVRLATPDNREYQQVQVRVVAPPNGRLSPLARDAAAELRGRGNIDAAALRLYALLGQSSGSNELLSYLLFEPEFFRRQLEAAEQDARETIATWGAAPAFV